MKKEDENEEAEEIEGNDDKCGMLLIKYNQERPNKKGEPNKRYGAHVYCLKVNPRRWLVDIFEMDEDAQSNLPKMIEEILACSMIFL